MNKELSDVVSDAVNICRRISIKYIPKEEYFIVPNSNQGLIELRFAMEYALSYHPDMKMDYLLDEIRSYKGGELVIEKIKPTLRGVQEATDIRRDWERALKGDIETLCLKLHCHLWQKDLDKLLEIWNSGSEYQGRIKNLLEGCGIDMELETPEFV